MRSTLLFLLVSLSAFAQVKTVERDGGVTTVLELPGAGSVCNSLLAPIMAMPYGQPYVARICGHNGDVVIPAGNLVVNGNVSGNAGTFTGPIAAPGGTFTGNVSIGNTLPTGWTNVAAWGDSLTSGNQDLTGPTYPSALSTAMSGTSVYNGGVGGNTSTQIATRMLAATDKYGYFSIFWAGANNFASQSTILADVASMVAALTGTKRYLVLGVLNGNFPDRQSGQTGYGQILADNAALAAAYPANYFDARAYLISLATSSAEDVIDVAHDVIPTSLRANYPTGVVGTLNGTIDNAVTAFVITTANGGTGSTMTIDSEKIYVIAQTGTSITNCIRGYAGTTAASHTTGAAVSAVDGLHLNGTAYTLLGNRIWAWMQANTPNYAVGSQNITSLFISPNFQAITAGTGVLNTPAAQFFVAPHVTISMSATNDYTGKLISNYDIGLVSSATRSIYFYPGAYN